MSDLFVSLVAIAPKPGQFTVQPGTGSNNQDFSGIHSDIQQNKVATPGGIQK